jgi:ammonia channel protein AmtB
MQSTQVAPAASMLQLWGAGAFGFLIGWYVYYINRYRKGDVQLSDLVTLIGVVGGGGVLALFPAKSDLFGAYGIGLAAGFFSYFIVLIILVCISKNFDVDWFLDGRRKSPGTDYIAPGDNKGAMGDEEH